jgi:N-acetylmuramoyl-L-alanine amidase
MIRNLGRIKTVVLDPGHGGVEKGAASSYGNEKDFTLDVALKLRPLLQAKGFQVVMTREKDELVPLHERARIANATRDSIFVSIHFNATDYNGAATGFEIYSLTPRGAPSTSDNALLERFLNMQAGSPVDAPSVILSTSVYHAMLGHMPEFDRGVKRARFAVLRLTSIPAILVEGGFLTEREESRLIARPEWRAKLAQAIAIGIENYRGLAEKRERPLLLADYRRRIEGVLVARNPTAPADAAAMPPVFAASNQLVPSAQITQPLRHEPSEQIAITPEMAKAMSASAPATQASPPAAEVDSAHHEETEEGAVGTVADAGEPVEATPADAGEMPDTQPPDPAANQASVEATPPPVGPAPANLPPATVLRRYWISNIAPPPKFRE